MQIIAENIEKYFGEKKIFSNISFDISSGSSISITGPNGSGKTTLIRILCGLINSTTGTIKFIEKNKELNNRDRFNCLGLVGPYLELYDNLTAFENLIFFARLKRIQDKETKISDLMKQMNLNGYETELVKNYSSGMKQRLKYVFALLGSPKILFLDEPTSNLDNQGKKTIYDIMDKQRANNILILATNDSEDLKFGDNQIAVNS